jgi:hypothetical protein
VAGPAPLGWNSTPEALGACLPLPGESRRRLARIEHAWSEPKEGRKAVSPLVINLQNKKSTCQTIHNLVILFKSQRKRFLNKDRDNVTVGRARHWRPAADDSDPGLYRQLDSTAALTTRIPSRLGIPGPGTGASVAAAADSDPGGRGVSPVARTRRRR